MTWLLGVSVRELPAYGPSEGVSFRYLLRVACQQSQMTGFTPLQNSCYVLSLHEGGLLKSRRDRTRTSNAAAPETVSTQEKCSCRCNHTRSKQKTSKLAEMLCEKQPESFNQSDCLEIYYVDRIIHTRKNTLAEAELDNMQSWTTLIRR